MDSNPELDKLIQDALAAFEDWCQQCDSTDVEQFLAETKLPGRVIDEVRAHHLREQAMQDMLGGNAAGETVFQPTRSRGPDRKPQRQSIGQYKLLQIIVSLGNFAHCNCPWRKRLRPRRRFQETYYSGPRCRGPCCRQPNRARDGLAVVLLNASGLGNTKSKDRLNRMIEVLESEPGDIDQRLLAQGYHNRAYYQKGADQVADAAKAIELFEAYLKSKDGDPTASDLAELAEYYDWMATVQPDLAERKRLLLRLLKSWSGNCWFRPIRQTCKLRQPISFTTSAQPFSREVVIRSRD